MYADGNGLFEEIGEMFKTRKKSRNNVIREKNNIKNSVLDYIRYKQLNWYGQERMKKGSLGKFWNVAHLEHEEGEDLEIRGCRRS